MFPSCHILAVVIESEKTNSKHTNNYTNSFSDQISDFGQSFKE